jgi:lipopolysaccharide transport system permease protein
MNNTRIVIEAGRTAAQYWRDLWRYRELLYFLAWRDIAIHYKQTVLGAAWALVRPLSTVLVFVLVFNKVAQIQSPVEGLPYTLFVLAAMLPWQLFSSSLSQVSNSLVANSNLVSKVYFPRLVLPLSAVGVSLVDFVITLAAMFGLMAFFGVAPTWRILTLPFFLAVSVIAALGAGLWLGALCVRYRDVRHITPFLVQFGLFISPVAYGTQMVLAKIPGYELLYQLNPMVGVIDGFRWALLHAAPLDWPSMGLSILLNLALLASGIWYFRKTEKTFADVI